MVMEAPPSPQSVGREFVRQYYTLLNKAPTHLHRFYNHQSSFVHGGLDPPNRETTPVIGQKQIHQKIQQLNFRDCHAKITQVDSQATLGNGVVVQVTGELSNAGQPMRRFTQTFVLAAQSPKKYYVHNDIFRYQDEIISDEECEADAHSDVEEDVISERQAKPVLPPEVQPQITTMPQYYNVSAPSTPLQPPNINQVPIHHNQQHPPHVMGNQPPVATVNGAVHPDDISVIPNQVPAHISSTPAQPNLSTSMPGLQQGLVQNPMKPPTPVDDQQSSAIEDNLEDLDQSFNDQQDIEHEQSLPMESASIEPKTYANLLKSGNNAIPPYSNQLGGTVAPSAPLGQPQPQQQQQQQQQQPPQPQQQQQQQIRPISPTSGVGSGFATRSVVTSAGLNSRGGSGVRLNQQQPTRLPNRQDSGRSGMVGRNSINEEGSYEDKRRSQGSNFNDMNQLFLGNLPHTATDEELREIFSQYGKIMELRILSKPVNKMGGPQGGTRLPPNYGFITYETETEVKACLSARPIFYPKNDVNGTSLNVEEKKTKGGPYGGSGGGRPMPEPNMRGGRGDMGGAGGQRRGGAPNRNPAGGQGGGAPGPNNRSSNSYNNMSSRGGPQGRGGAPGAYRR